MKATTILTAGFLATSTVAAPGGWHGEGNVGWHGGWGGWGGHGKDGWKGNWKHDDKGHCKDECDKKYPIPFTSTYSVVATPDQVINGTEPTGGLPGAIGYYDFGINSEYNFICYHIRLYGFKGEYQSLAKTSTHIHEGAKGASGPPRIVFPNPMTTGKKDERLSVGCVWGPFVTGLADETTRKDFGVGFKVSQIEANPSAFFCDVHSSLAVPGAVRGQLY